MLDKYGVELIGAKLPAIKKAEDRNLFKEAMERIGLDLPRSGYARTFAEAEAIRQELGLPLIIRPSRTLGGMGGSLVATLEDLDESALVEILTRPKNALLKQYQRLFDMESVKLKFTDDALKAVAQKAIIRKTGARGLRSIIETVLLDTMYDLPSLDGVDEVVINREVIEGRAQPLYVHGERKEGIAAAPA